MKKHVLILFALFFSLISVAQNEIIEAPQANTPGTLTISTKTLSAGGGYAPNNIVAIWVQNSTGGFVKTLLAYAAARKSDLTNWKTATSSTYNVVDAVTAATQTSHGTRTCTWNATNTSTPRAVVVDGTYTIKFELNDGNSKLATYTFVKGPTPSSGVLSGTATSSFSNVSIQWVPASTGIDEVKLAKLYSIYPNPAVSSIYVNGLDIIDIDILALSGESLYKASHQKIDINSLQRGSYLVLINTKKGTIVKKLIKL